MFAKVQTVRALRRCACFTFEKPTTSVCLKEGHLNGGTAASPPLINLGLSGKHSAAVI